MIFCTNICYIYLMVMKVVVLMNLVVAYYLGLSIGINLVGIINSALYVKNNSK